MIRFAEVAIGTGGVGRCLACGAADAVAHIPTDRVVERIDEVLAGWQDAAGPNVFFTGIEPFAHPDLPRLIEAARMRGFERIKLRTDGRFLDKGGNAAGAFSAGVTHLELVLLAGGAEDHDRLCGAPGGFASAVSGVSAYRAIAREGGVFTGHIPLCRHNVKFAPGTMAKFAELGAVAVDVDVCALKRSEENEALVSAALQTATVNRMAAFVSGGPVGAWSAHRMAPYEYSDVTA